MPPHLGKKYLFQQPICPILTSKKIGLCFLNAQNPSKKVSIHYNISLYLLTPKFCIKPLIFFPPLPVQDVFFPKKPPSYFMSTPPVF